MPPDNQTPVPPAPSPEGQPGSQPPQVYGPQTPGQTVQPQAPGTQAVPPQPSPGGFITPTQPMGPEQPSPPPSPGDSYSFITDPAAPPKQSLSLPGASSLIGRVGLIAGGLVVLIILFMVIKGVLGGGGGAMDTLITVAQDQQEMIHIASAASQQQGLSSANQDFTATVETAVASSQSQLISYLATNHKKLNDKLLNLKVSSTVDDQLSAAAASGSYNQTYQEVMRAQLNTYGSDLQKAYQAITGKNGRALLKDTYNQALLLATQLNSRDG